MTKCQHEAVAFAIDAWVEAHKRPCRIHVNTPNDVAVVGVPPRITGMEDKVVWVDCWVVLVMALTINHELQSSYQGGEVKSRRNPRCG